MKFKVGDVIICKSKNYNDIEDKDKYTIEDVVNNRNVYLIKGYGVYSCTVIEQYYKKYSYRIEKLERLLR